MAGSDAGRGWCHTTCRGTADGAADCTVDGATECSADGVLHGWQSVARVAECVLWFVVLGEGEGGFCQLTQIGAWASACARVSRGRMVGECAVG